MSKVKPKKQVKQTKQDTKPDAKPDAKPDIKLKEVLVGDNKQETQEPRESKEKYEKNMLYTLDKEYIPVVYELSKQTNNIFSHESDSLWSHNIDYPKSSYGFHHYLHQSKDKMKITEEFEGKRKVYLVFNQFETDVENYENNIKNVAKTYFNVESFNDIQSRAFFKLWEMLFMFDIVPLDKPNFTSVHLAEGPGSFIQATMFFRDMFAKKVSTKNDKYYTITLHQDKEKQVTSFSGGFVKHYEKEKPQRLHIYETSAKNNGDLTNLKTIQNFADMLKGQKVDFITADGGFVWKDENLQEQEMFTLLIAEIITALKLQNKGGNFVCKFFESFTDTTIKILSILQEFYTNVYAVKPLLSRRSNSEKYFICINFKDPKDKEKQINILENILEDAQKYKNKHLVSIFPNFNPEEKYINKIIKINTAISNFQFIRINEMVDFIQQQNYRGDVYETRHKMQIEASKYWIDLFLPDPKNFDEKRKHVLKLTDLILKQNT